MEHSRNIKSEKKFQPVSRSLEKKTIQNKAIALEDNRPFSVLQRKANNTGLPDNLKSGIENLSGHAMDDVKVHYNSDKPAQLNAHAYAQGSEIHLASGQEKHLPHEAWHVVQQKQGRVKPTMQMKGKVNVNDDTGLEKEADVMGERANQYESYTVQNYPQPAQLQDHAFEQGNQIHIASGEERHLPHEAWHVVQQKQGGVSPTKQLKGKVNINDNPGASPAIGDNSNVAQLVIDPELFKTKLKNDYPRWNPSIPDSMSNLFEAVNQYYKDQSEARLYNVFAIKRALKSKYYKRFGNAINWLDYRLESESLSHSAKPAKEKEKPLKQYGDEGTYDAFMQNLAEVDSSELPPVEKQKIKVRLLSEFHHHLKTLPVSEIRKFGGQLQGSIATHEKTDTLDKALSENRAIYRSWHEPRRISESTDLGAMVEGGQELVGADSLKVALNPERFIKHKAETKKPGSKFVPIGAVPSSLLYSGQKNTVFNKDRGTATALLPENLYAGFSAYNETVKSLGERSHEELGDGAEELQGHAKLMRASVTRPVFFDKNDIQSSTGAYHHHSKPDGPHVRKTHSYLDETHNPLKESLDQKLADPLRANAIFYQTFTQHSKANPHADEWNEMVVKYRSTGHTAGLHENIREWVPGLEAHPIVDRLENSGNFSQEFADSTAKWSPSSLRGQDFDSQKAKKQSHRKK